MNRVSNLIDRRQCNRLRSICVLVGLLVLTASSACRPFRAGPSQSISDGFSGLYLDRLQVEKAETDLGLRAGEKNKLPEWVEFPKDEYRWNTSRLKLALDPQTTSGHETLRFASHSNANEVKLLARVGLQRLGKDHSRYLESAISDPSLSPGSRRAALETFIKTSPPQGQLPRLLKYQEAWLPQPDLRVVQKSKDQKHDPKLPPALQAELLSLLYETGNARSIELAHWLQSPNAGIRRTALRGVRDLEWPVDQDTLDRLAKEKDRSVRLEAIYFLGGQCRTVPQVLETLLPNLQHMEFTVRKATIQALGKAGTTEAQGALRQRLSRGGTSLAEQAEILRALGRAGDLQTVYAYADHKKGRLREAVAQSVSFDNSRTSVEIAERLMLDQWMPVPLALIESLKQWPLRDAGPFLFSMVELDNRLVVRQAAASHLASRLNMEEADAQKTAALKNAWVAQNGTLDANWKRLRSRTKRLEDRAGSEPQIDGWLTKLRSGERWIRREAARAISQRATSVPLNQTTRRELVSVLEKEADVKIWTYLLQSLTRTRSTEGSLAAYWAMNHSQASIRRQGLQYLIRYPEPEHARIALALTNDSQKEISILALQAYVLCKGPPTRRLVALAGAEDPGIAVAAAKAMSDLGMPEGQRSLSMLAKHDVPAVRQQVIEIMGRSAKVVFRPDVIYAMSDKSTAVQLAAFSAIESLSEDPAAVLQARSIPANSRAAFWKEWQRNLLQRR